MKMRTLKHRTMATAARHIAGAEKTAQWFRHAPWQIPTGDRRRDKRDARKGAKFVGETPWAWDGIDKSAKERAMRQAALYEAMSRMAHQLSGAPSAG